jgi:soluble lytic murein transglycosylase-like protein
MSRYCFLQKAAPLLSFFLLTAASAAALKDTTDPNMAWQNYLDTDTQIEPSYRFPHANCFRVAALTYDLPHTLLLAVARGESDFDTTARSRANAHTLSERNADPLRR